MAPRINAGARHIMALATHGSAPDIAGRNIANPYALIMSGQMMLEVLGHRLDHGPAIRAAEAIAQACARVLEGRISLTPGFGGSASPIELGDAIARELEYAGPPAGLAKPPRPHQRGQ